MTTYISILRGINVSGHKLIPMEALRKSYEKLGFQSVTSYLQSGNVVFKSHSLTEDELPRVIAQQIKQDFGFDVPVLVFKTEQFQHLIDRNPFIQDPDKQPAFLHVTFLSAPPQKNNAPSIAQKKSPEEELFFSENAVYLYCPNGYGKTKLTNGFLETKLQVVATTRNWKTTTALLKIAQETH